MAEKQNLKDVPARPTDKLFMARDERGTQVLACLLHQVLKLQLALLTKFILHFWCAAGVTLGTHTQMFTCETKWKIGRQTQNERERDKKKESELGWDHGGGLPHEEGKPSNRKRHCLIRMLLRIWIPIADCLMQDHTPDEMVKLHWESTTELNRPRYYTAPTLTSIIL